MKKRHILFLFVTAWISSSSLKTPKIIEHTLENGLKVLIQKSKNTNNVAIQLYYNVGSKDEKDHEKGLAHLLEHMIFKGTQKLSEVDITLATDKLSGWCNANTSLDRTCYEFNLPKRHWHEAIPILADCMTNCTFKDDHLNSEFKAVIQELKMGRDDFGRSMFLELMSISFPDHPYHFPTIGYKQNIWNTKGKDLHKFYKKHYIPNNAVLVIVGDVDKQEAISIIEQNFNKIKSNPDYEKRKNFLNPDLISRSFTIYRDVKVPSVWLSFNIPGKNGKKDHILNCIIKALCGDNFSRLNKILVEEKQLVYSIGAFNISLYEHGMFIISFEPRDMNKCPEIENIIKEEIENIKNGLSEFELKKTVNQNKAEFFDTIENNREKASLIGEYYLACKDYLYPFSCVNLDKNKINNEIKEFAQKYLRTSIVNKCTILPIPEDEKQNWKEIQELSDEQDKQILSERIRESSVEDALYANNITPKSIEKIDCLNPEEFTLKNGIKVFFIKDTKSPKINLAISLKANSLYEPNDMPGIYNLTINSILRGTKKHSYQEVTDFLTKKAINLNFNDGSINLSCLKSKFLKSLELLHEILTEPLFDNDQIQKNKALIKNDIKNFWDSPNLIADHLLNKEIYKNSLLSKNKATEEQIDKYTQKDVLEYYKKFITPYKASIVVSGDIELEELKNILEKTLANWQGQSIPKKEKIKIKETKEKIIHHNIDRDQTIFCIGTKSVKYNDPNYCKLILATLILSQGMSSKLFLIREQTGLFYTYNGSLVTNAGKNEGIIKLGSIVSNENVEKTKSLFLDLIKNLHLMINEDDLAKAKNFYLEIISNKYSSRSSIINTIIQLNYYKLEWNFYKKLIKEIKEVTLEDVKNCLQDLIQNKEFVTVTVGREIN